MKKWYSYWAKNCWIYRMQTHRSSRNEKRRWRLSKNNDESVNITWIRSQSQLKRKRKNDTYPKWTQEVQWKRWWSIGGEKRSSILIPELRFHKISNEKNEFWWSGRINLFWLWYSVEVSKIYLLNQENDYIRFIYIQQSNLNKC